MITVLLRRSLAWLRAALLCACSAFVHAGGWDHEDAYWHGPLWARELTQPTWMSAIHDDTPLLSLSIPGTHDSASTGKGGDIVQNQSMPISDQLLAGIRYLDFRCRLHDDSLQFHHGLVWLEKSCASGFADVANFLLDHPSETVLIQLQQEHSTASNEEFERALDKMLSRFRAFLWEGDLFDRNPRLGDIRGKIVLVARFKQSKLLGLLHSEFLSFDDHKLSTNWDLHDHWSKVKSRLASLAPSQWRGHLTYIVGSGGVFPYFAASGRSSPRGPHLATGLTTPGWASSYPDFPRDACFIGICSIYFKGLNELTAEYLRKQRLDFVGIVVADFPGRLLIDTIIERNAKRWQRGGLAQAGEVFVHHNPYTQATEYLAAKREGPYWYFPTDGRDNEDWIFLGHQFPTGPNFRYWSQTAASNIGDLYAYRNPHTHSIDFFKAKRAGYYAHEKRWFPIDQTSDDQWEFLGQSGRPGNPLR